MTRTTPPRPVDITTLFPELRDHSSVATRLHPRPGAPTATDSSIGGPLLWPADEPWPYCDDPHDYLHQLKTPAAVRRWRQLIDVGRRRVAAGERSGPTDQEQAEMHEFINRSEPYELARQPIAMVPVAQLYRRDTPGFLGPPDSDLMQVVWCPIDHDRLDYCPRLLIKWRRLADIGEPLIAPPEPVVVCADYLPNPCVVHPEQVVEFDSHGLPSELRERIRVWGKESGHDYSSDLSIAPGWKIGGFTTWTFIDAHPMVCECGADLSVLMRVASAEWKRNSVSWRPVEDEPGQERDPGSRAHEPTAIHIGRGYSLWVYHCPRSYDHPHQTAMQ